MGWSRETSLYTLLVIDGVFFFVEIIVGYAVGSLALVADSFHMLNDVVSLIVALYAIKLANSTDSTSSSKYSYGWQRAEILGSLVNGVFLLALCFSIFLESVERFFSHPDISNPKLVVIVGSLGLLSNVVGLILFHDHGHAHGGHSHSHSSGGGGHSHSNSADLAEQGHSHSHSQPLQITASSNEIPFEEEEATSEDADELDELLYAHPAAARANLIRAARDNTLSLSGHRRKRSVSSMSTSNKPESILRTSRSSAPAKVGKLVDIDGSPDTHTHSGHAHSSDADQATATHPGENAKKHVDFKVQNGRYHDDEEDGDADSGHAEHSSGGAGHGSMNMRGVFLHVLGDFLGNIGVVISGLIIWLTRWPGRFYADPIISLVITFIIFSSALPLVKSASFILLQGTPSDVPLEEVRAAICRIDGVEDVHELHVWSLSESKIIGSVHVLVKNSDDIVFISHRVREVMHQFGIHSSTIQPETLGEFKTALAATKAVPTQELNAFSEAQFSKAASSNTCLVQCVGQCHVPGCCNKPASKAPSITGSDQHQ